MLSCMRIVVYCGAVLLGTTAAGSEWLDFDARSSPGRAGKGSAAAAPDWIASVLLAFGCGAVGLACGNTGGRDELGSDERTGCGDRLCLGETVRVIRGSLSGLVGQICQFVAPERCVLVVDRLPSSTRIVVPLAAVEPIWALTSELALISPGKCDSPPAAGD